MEWLYLHPDHLNTPRAVVHPVSKATLWSWSAGSAFGIFPPQEDPDLDGQKFVLNLRFPGQYYDQESGLHDNVNRTYAPALGRYLQSDPIGLSGGLNTFAYVGSNPLNLVDPLGLTSLEFDIRKGKMTVYPEHSGSDPYTGSYDVPATSGRDECMNNPECSAVKYKGPIPPGEYIINADEVVDPNIVMDIVNLARNGDWGDWRAPVRPSEGTDTQQRDGFYLHGGLFKGSAGCIDIGGGVTGNATTDKIMNNIINDANSKIPVTVR